MAKKPSMPDFTFALGADLREAAAKMRKMSQPPKHQSAQQANDEPADVQSDDMQEALEDSMQEPSVTAEPTLVAKSNIDAASTSDALEMDSLHCEESFATIESGESTFPVDSIEPVIDAVQPLEGTPSETGEQEPAALKKEETPVPSSPKPVTECTESSQEKSFTPFAVEERGLEPLQSVSPEAPSENADTASACAPEAIPAEPRPHLTANQPSEASVTVVQAEHSDKIHLDYRAEQSQTASDSSIQKDTSTDSYRRTAIEKDSHQQSQDSTYTSPTANDMFISADEHKRADSPNSPETTVPANVSSRSTYSLLTYGQSQTVTDYQIYSTSSAMSPHGYKDISTIPQNPFQSKTIEAEASPAERLAVQNDGHKLSQTAAITPAEKQVAAKDFLQNQPTVAQSNTSQGLSPSIIAATLQDAHLGGARQILLDALTALRQQSPQVVVNLKRLAPAIGLSYGTVRNTISRLVREGVICTTQVRTGDAHGVCVEFIDDNPLPSMTVPSRTRQPMLHQQQPPTVIKNHEMTPVPPMNDACIWDTDADLIAILWPFAADAGFGPAHLAQLRRAYQLQGWESENVSRCLRYLDWELSNGVAASHEHMATWLRIMQRQGHYPRPEGYVDPEILRLRQQAEEERELAEARTRFK